MEKSFSDRFRVLRKAKFPKQDQFLKAFTKMFGSEGTPQQPSVSYWEHGKSEPSFVLGCKVAAVLGVSAEALGGIRPYVPDLYQSLPANESEALRALKRLHAAAEIKIKQQEEELSRYKKIWAMMADEQKKQ